MSIEERTRYYKYQTRVKTDQHDTRRRFQTS